MYIPEMPEVVFMTFCLVLSPCKSTFNTIFCKEKTIKHQILNERKFGRAESNVMTSDLHRHLGIIFLCLKINSNSES